MADAAYVIVNRPLRQCTGRFFIDELVLREEGVTDFSQYAAPDAEALAADFFVPDAVFEKTDTKVARAGLSRASE
jgi:citronellol/citronellal dehydrogenase